MYGGDAVMDADGGKGVEYVEGEAQVKIWESERWHGRGSLGTLELGHGQGKHMHDL